MKKLYIYIIIVITLFFSANAEGRFRKEVLWNLLAAPAYGFVQLNIHEGSHALGALTVGAELIQYQPYPSLENGIFMWGKVVTNKIYDRHENGFVLVAPYISDVVIFTASDIILSTEVISPHSISGGILFIAGMVAPFADFVANINNWSEGNDFTRISELYDIPRVFPMIIGNIISAVALWRIVAVGMKVFFEEEEETQQISFSVMPTVGGGGSMSFSFQF
ncbi:MAG: hypothetical protein WC430_03660 [Patescibacteria group bacterium]